MGGDTCLQDLGCILGEASGVAEPTNVLAENTEIVFIAHDEVGHGAAGGAAVLIDGEPLLARRHGGPGQLGTQTQEESGDEDSTPKCVQS